MNEHEFVYTTQIAEFDEPVGCGQTSNSNRCGTVKSDKAEYSDEDDLDYVEQAD